MKEDTVVEAVSDYFNQNNFSVWIDEHPDYNKNIFTKYKKHNIKVGGFIPDIVALDPFKQVHLVEAKGSTDIRKGIGQALTYKEGASYVYLAAAQTEISPFKNVILSSGINVLGVNEQTLEVNEVKSRNIMFAKYLPDVLASIELLQMGRPRNEQVSKLNRNHPLNYTAVIYLIDEQSFKDKKQVEDELKVFNVADTKGMINGSQILGLIREDNGHLLLTEDGRFLKNVLQKLGYLNINELKELKDKSGGHKKGRPTLYDTDKLVAQLIGIIYEKQPEVVQFKNHLIKLSKTNKKLTFKEIVEDIIIESPNLYLNFICLDKTEIREIVKKWYQEKNYVKLKNSINIVKFMRTTVKDAFKSHLIHLGILERGGRIHSDGRKGYDPAEDYWIIRN